VTFFGRRSPSSARTSMFMLVSWGQFVYDGPVDPDGSIWTG